jgi:hypothetical protein
MTDPDLSVGSLNDLPYGPLERWKICPSTHCLRWQECRSPHECSGTGKNKAQLKDYR